MSVQRLSLLTTLAISMCMAAATSVLAAPTFPQVIPLPDGWRPEGITAGRGSTVFVGSLANGAIWKGDVRTGTGDVFVGGQAGHVAVGMEYEERANRLWVAGGPYGRGARSTTRPRASCLRRTHSAMSGFLNDLVVTRQAVYVTDSFAHPA